MIGPVMVTEPRETCRECERLKVRKGSQGIYCWCLHPQAKGWIIGPTDTTPDWCPARKEVKNA
jgi:hypothetical protein